MPETARDTIQNALRALRIVPVIVVDDPAHAVPLADALCTGGLPCAEITFRTAGAVEALRRITAERPDLLVGAGTVLTPRQASEARAAGARFLVAPGFNPAVVEYALEHEIPVIPGVCTPTEIEAALARGLTTLKFFPAEPMGGLSFLKAISAPYSMVEFVPTGGINAGNLGGYLSFKKVIACGGSWMAPAEWIQSGDFARIAEETGRAVAVARGGVGADR